MESVVLEEVFQTWKLFDDLVDSLLKPGSIDKGTIQVLANMVMSKEFSRTFLYNKEPGITFQAYKDIVDKYHSFTTWLLGQFFYLLSRDDGEIIVDAQLSIMDQLSRTQVHTYADLANEYCKSLDILCGYLKNPSEIIRISTFEPKKNEDLNKKLSLKRTTIDLNSERICLNLIKKVLKILKFILVESVSFYSCDASTYTALDNLLYLLSYGHLEMPIFEIFIELLERLNCNSKEGNNKMFVKIRSFSSLFEQFVYDFYNNGNFKLVDQEYFENLLFKYIEFSAKLKLSIGQNYERISTFIIRHCLDNKRQEKLVPSEKIQYVCTQISGPSEYCISFATICDCNVVGQNNSVMFRLLKTTLFREICDFFETHPHLTHIDIYETNERWKYFCSELAASLDKVDCSNVQCKLERKLKFLLNVMHDLLELKCKFSRNYRNTRCTLNFFSDAVLLPKLFSSVISHYETCKNKLDPMLILRLLVKQLSVVENKNIDIVYHLVACQILVPSFCKLNLLPHNFIGNIADRAKVNEHIKLAYSTIVNDERLRKRDVWDVVNEFFRWISSGLVQNLNQSHMNLIESLHIKMVKHFKESDDPEIVCRVLENIPEMLYVFSDKNDILCNILLPILPVQVSIVQQKVAEIIPIIMCTSFSDYFKIISTDGIEIVCEKCTLKCEPQDKDKCLEYYLKNEENAMSVNFSKNRLDLAALTGHFLKNVLNYLIGTDVDVKVKALELMPSLSHIPKFYSLNVTKMWIERAGEARVEVRNALIKVVRRTVLNGQKNTVVSEATKKEVLEEIFSVLQRLSKKSLQHSEYELQETLLSTLDELGQIDDDQIKLKCMEIMLYFIMVPTSSQSYIAVNKCSNLSKKDGSGQLSIYKRNSETFCEIIAHLCYVNQYLINASLQDSLVKVTVMLGFEGFKDFLIKEAKKLLPFLVSKMVNDLNVQKLIEDMAMIMGVELSDLISRNYGNIFLYLFLGNMDKEGSKLCSAYLEKTAKMSGPKLRKSNIRVILNELLLNFHEKRDKVLTTLKLLVQEDTTNSSTSVEDYLKPYFLAFLLYFDLELTSEYSKKEKILLSLADLFRFLGPQRITPLRFKIIAMLQTTHYLKHPELTCVVWDSFVRSCDMDCLGPHLATIFTSMWPLIKTCPNKINKILQFLVVQNETYMGNHIEDLFFVDHSYLLTNVSSIIKKHRKSLEHFPLKKQIQWYLTYLKHDTLEVRMQSLRQLKTCLEQNREELDQMILGYNGIDGTIVELIDYLTLGCREKDETVRLACGEIFGELGAIEPSHLPRRYAQDNKSFIFFTSDDLFVESALNELIKAFQTDKNARNTDRVALAIQEILKTYKISPNESDEKNFMWKKFSEAQREVMAPLLSSKYICVEKFTGYPCPLYGSTAGSSFHAWLYNWTSSLISTLPEEERSLLQSCFPSMKLDKRVLMHFLPYILLHSLLEGNSGNDEKSYTEFETILNSFHRQRIIDEKILNNRPLPIPGITPSAREVTAEEEKQIQCTKVVFILLDFLDRWLREWLWLKGQSAGIDRNYQNVKRFLKRFCKLELAKCNYKCGEYPRALMYLEDYMAENPDELCDNLPFLAEIYAQLDEPDGVLGVEPLQQSEPFLEQRLLSLEVSGKLADAAAIYEHMPRPLKLQHVQGLIQCYLDLDKVNTALYFAEGALDLQPEFGNMLLEMQAEPLWRLGKYDDLEKLLNKPDILENKSWGVQVGRALMCIRKGERDEFKSVLESIKKQQIDSFAAASLEEGAYQHGYSYITRLHCANELAQIEQTLFELFLKPNDRNYSESIMKKLSNEWQLRIKVVQESVRVIEPLLCVRKVALNWGRDIVEKKAPQAVPYFDNLLGECWLQSVNIAMTAGVHQQAYTYVLDAEKYYPPKLFIEKAKLHWIREEHEEALITLKRGLNVYIPDNTTSQETQQTIAMLDLEKKKLCAEARLLIATYNDAICSVDVEMNLQQYKEAVEVFKEWEKSIVCLAQYQDRILQNYSDEEKDTKANDVQLHIIHNFGKSLYYGTNFIYQSMPRLLSIWFDYGTRLVDVTNIPVREERRNVLLKMTKIIDGFLNKLPSFIFLTSFSQIISRISHPQKEVYIQLKSIIIKLMQDYPQQCLWMISSVIKSSYPTRAKRCAEILSDSKLRTNTITKLVRDFTSLAEKLIELCNKDLDPDLSTASVNLLVRSLPRMLTKGDFSEIMMPTHKFRKLVIPNPDFKNTQHNPFPNHYVHIVGIDDNITILQSLQRPRKINLRGSDGKSYTFMLKPKDDLRKDFRLMEFNDIVNHLMLRDAEARQRRLNIRLYSVAPLNEECGLIEWVDNLVGLRPVLMNLYKQKGTFMKPKEIREVQCNVRDPLAKKRDIFCNILLKKHPPVLGNWFRKTFPDAQTWLTARTGYIRTTAVISITGYILGLGDRHGENILLDSTCGDVVHVDFNCLFNKGETFEWPERVPFRLTQNMVSAMGPLGVEGVFRKSCEFTLRVLRANIATLMSIVTPFVYDPLLTCPKNMPTGAQSTERVNEQALEHVKNIELRLQGKVKTRSRTMSQCLSVEGQTDYLINEAKSTDNLCQMYIGWGPYL